MSQGLLFIVSAPSGTGKTTLIKRLVECVPGIVMSRSYTSRPARPGEVDGVDYTFVSDEQFTKMVEGDGFLEWAHIFGHRYGTSRSAINGYRSEGHDVVLVIDVQGAKQVRSRSDDAITIFVLPPSHQVLETRLRQRSGQDATEEELQTRLETARQEVAQSDGYDYVVVNDEIGRCVEQLQSIVVAERSRAAVVNETVDEILSAFQVIGD